MHLPVQHSSVCGEYSFLVTLIAIPCTCIRYSRFLIYFFIWNYKTAYIIMTVAYAVSSLKCGKKYVKYDLGTVTKFYKIATSGHFG